MTNDPVTRKRASLRLRGMRTVFASLLATMALLAVACGGEAGSTSTTVPSTTTTTVSSTTTTIAPSTTTSTIPATTTTAPSTTTTTTLAGGPIEFGPVEGDVLMVIGVRHDDVLNLREAPGTNHAIEDGIPPTHTDLVARGNTWKLPSSFWIEVDYVGTVGWVHMGYVGYEGATIDDTARLVSELGETPVEATMADLGRLVAETYASDDEQGSDIAQVTPVTTGDLAEVTYDVVGLADDAIRGVRIHIFAGQGGDGFTLRTVEVTSICARGVDENGLCP